MSTLRTAPAWAAALLALALAPAQAAPIHVAPGGPAVELLSNGSFETVSQNGGSGFCYTGNGLAGCAISGWTGSNGTVVITSTNGPWNNPASTGGNQGSGLGSYVVGLQGDGSSLSQLVEASGAALYQFTLRWFDGGRNSGLYSANTYDVLFDGALLGRYTTAAGQAWAQHSLSFLSDGSGVLSFVNLSLAGDHTSFLNNVSLTATAAVAEPGSLAIATLALATLGGLRRRRG